MFKIILLISIIFGLNACKGEDMNNNEDTNKDIKTVYAPNAVGIDFNTKTNEFLFSKQDDETGKYTKEYSKALLEAVNIVD
ncbi:TPA: hypothetical protein RZK23_001629, partial [Campylobacter coli]|nr:hypothetical protein [Campylobacter coli]